jgi:hypothetical protein
MSNAAHIPDFPETPENAAKPQVRSMSRNAPLLSPDSGVPNETESSEIRSRPLNIFFASFPVIAEECGSVVQTSIEWARGVGGRVRKVKDEKPVQLLALIAGTAFALGVAARFWRKKL